MTHFKRYVSTAQIPLAWNALVRHDIFLQMPYLKALEKAAPTTITPYYIGVFKDDALVGIALIQRVELYAKDIFRTDSSSKLLAIFKDGLSRILKGNILVVGNMTHTGQHGMYFNSESISPIEFLEILYEAIEDLKTHIKEQGTKSIRAVLFKDYFKNDSIHQATKLLIRQGFYHLDVQPNMILDIRQHWQTIYDYFNDLNKKYKIRYKRAKKKLGPITLKEMTTDAILENSDQLYHLYKNVSNKASFNTFVLPKYHFYTYKLQLKNNFRIFAYYQSGQMIGFFSLIMNKAKLETYFLGYEDAHQHTNQLYLNMLYDMISFGIENGVETIVFARTALEIKSSVGATPRPMSMYMRHTHPIVNVLLKFIFKVMNPELIFEERHPFKI